MKLLKNRLLNLGFIGEETEYWGKPAFKTGDQFNTFFEPFFDTPYPYIETLVVAISDDDYGILESEEGYENIDRLNVISIFGGDGTYEKWNKLTDLLESITEDEYQGGYELL